MTLSALPPAVTMEMPWWTGPLPSLSLEESKVILKEIKEDLSSAWRIGSLSLAQWGKRVSREVIALENLEDKDRISPPMSLMLTLAFVAGMSLSVQKASEPGPIDQYGRNSPSVLEQTWNNVKEGFSNLTSSSRDESASQDQEHSEADDEKEEAPHLIAVPVTPPSDGSWSETELAKALIDKDYFMGMALTIEKLPKFGYMDSGGANIGIGYCISCQLKNRGEEEVRDDLSRVGFSRHQIDDLVSEKPSRVRATEVTQLQALRLLALLKPRYEEMAIKAAGEEMWAKLPENKKATLTYLAYNTGGVASFERLLGAAKKGNDLAVLREMSVVWKDRSGNERKNHRLRAWAQAAWASPKILLEAISQPLLFELSFAGSRGQESFIKAAVDQKSTAKKPVMKELNLAENLDKRRKEQGIIVKNGKIVSAPNDKNDKSDKANKKDSKKEASLAKNLKEQRVKKQELAQAQKEEHEAGAAPVI